MYLLNRQSVMQTVTFTNIPDKISGAEYTKTAANSKTVTSVLGNFIAGENMTIYVALDSRVTEIPQWLTTWDKTDMTAANSNIVD